MRAEIDIVAAHIKANLKSQRSAFWSDTKQKVEKFRLEAASASKEECANLTWYLREVADARGLMTEAIDQIKKSEYYKAWCQLERIEITVASLLQNPFYAQNDFEITSLAEQVRQWQGLFPYRVFISPEIVVKKATCSICKTVIDPWEKCNHRVGSVYKGELCCRVIEECYLIRASLVLDPVQKYSVAFVKDINGKDQFDYSLVKFVADRIMNPFDRWSCELTTAYHSHGLFSDLSHDEPCPCDSGRQYKDCCISRPGVRRPHYALSFENEPTKELPAVALAGYERR